MNKASVSAVSVPNVKWKKYFIKRNGILVEGPFYDKKEAIARRDKINGKA